jgi:hypothetical protein
VRVAERMRVQLREVNGARHPACTGMRGARIVSMRRLIALAWIFVAASASGCAGDDSAAPSGSSVAHRHLPGAPLVALFDDGVLFGVGADGTVYAGDDLTEPVPALAGAKSIAGCPGRGFVILGSPPDDYACAALSNGDVVCKGSNVYGDLEPIVAASCDNPNNACPPNATYCFRLFGPTSYPCVSTWTPVPGVRALVQLHGTCGVDANGRLVCWGRAHAVAPPRPVKRLAGAFAILDDGTLYDRFAGAMVPGLSNVVDAAGSSASTACAVEADGSLWCWGSNRYGLVGDGTTIDRGAPTKVGTGFASVRIGEFFAETACAVTIDHGVSCWGVSGFAADAGAPGIECRGESCVATPTRVRGIDGVVQVVPVPLATAWVLTSDGRVVELSNVYESPARRVIHDVGR